LESKQYIAATRKLTMVGQKYFKGKRQTHVWGGMQFRKLQGGKIADRGEGLCPL